MPRRWLVLADDLTGAADCAIAFGRRGLTAAVSWGASCHEPRGARPSVFSFDVGSRSMTGGGAAARHTEALAHHLEADRILYKKIDSTLRGQPAAEVAATLTVLQRQGRRAFGIFAPAFPAAKRSTIDGRILVSGSPLEEMEVWRRDHSYPSSKLVEVMSSAGVKATQIDLASVRADPTTLSYAFEAVAESGVAVVVCDAETEADLLNIARASIALEPAPFFIGSAGFAHALAILEQQPSDTAPHLEQTSKGTLVVVGSLAAVSRAGARKLTASCLIRHIPVEPNLLLSPDLTARLALGQDIAARLARGEDLLVEIVMGSAPDMSLGSRLAAGLAEALAPAAEAIGALAATGGETAAALLSRFGVDGIRLIDEIEPGVSVGLTYGNLAIPVAMKAGAFGDENSLAQIASRLKLIKTEGRFL